MLTQYIGIQEEADHQDVALPISIAVRLLAFNKSQKRAGEEKCTPAKAGCSKCLSFPFVIHDRSRALAFVIATDIVTGRQNALPVTKCVKIADAVTVADARQKPR
jgi:hypothetical protein